MVKTPRTRHAKASRPPVTIDLEASEVSATPPREAAPDLPDDNAPAESTVSGPDTEVHAREEALSGLTPTEDAVPLAEPPDAAIGDRSPADEFISAPEEPGRPEEPSAETGTSIPPEQEYRPADAMDDGSADEPSPRREDPKPYATSAPPPPVVRKDGMGRIAAGIVGGVVVLAVAGGMQAAGLLGYPGGSAGPDNSAEIASLRGEIEALKGAAGGDGTDTARIDELSQGLDALRAEVAEIRQAAPAAGADGAGLGARLDTLEAELARLSSGGGSSEELSSLGERLAAVETTARDAQQASTSAAERLSALEQSVTSLTTRVEAQSQQPKIALAIATAALKAAVDRGAPFLAELETFAAIHPGTPEIETLRGYAEAGVPTRDALRTEMDAAATAMIAAAAPADPNSGFFDRLLASAESLVTVRPIGQVAGDGVPETLARMEVALNAGELDQALAEYETLPDPVKRAGAGFADRLKARAEVERQVDQAIATAMRA